MPEKHKGHASMAADNNLFEVKNRKKYQQIRRANLSYSHGFTPVIEQERANQYNHGHQVPHNKSKGDQQRQQEDTYLCPKIPPGYSATCLDPGVGQIQSDHVYRRSPYVFRVRWLIYGRRVVGRYLF